MKLLKSFLVVIIMAQGCSKDLDVRPSIIGDWRWVKTYYGFTNQTQTPKDLNFKIELTYDDYYYYQYLNGKLVEKLQYDLVVKPDSNMYIIYENSKEEIISYKRDSLLLYCYAGEGSLAYYVKR